MPAPNAAPAPAKPEPLGAALARVYGRVLAWPCPVCGGAYPCPCDSANDEPGAASPPATRVASALKRPAKDARHAPPT